MKLGLLLVVYTVKWSVGIRLNPLENNDKLQDISNQYVAEWQWESWPIKQEPSEQDAKTPGPRINVALWRDSSGPTWYLFGGMPVNGKSKKVYSDVWKYSVDTRVWERFFPSQSGGKEDNVAKLGTLKQIFEGGSINLRANLFDQEDQSVGAKQKNYNIILCGGSAKPNSTKPTKTDIWKGYTRRKKLIKEKTEEPKFLAVYAPKTSKSNTVWQIDLKEKLWTAYVCCCDSTNGSKDNVTLESDKAEPELEKEKNVTLVKTSNQSLVTLMESDTENYKNDSSSTIELNINKAEDEIDSQQLHFSMSNLKNKKKKINQNKKTDGNYNKKVEKKSGENLDGTKSLKNETQTTSENKTMNFTEGVPKTNSDLKSKKEKFNQKFKESSKILTNKTKELKSMTNESSSREKVDKGKTASQYCPEFSETGQPVTWCDGDSQLLITADISAPQITLWIFNLKTSHWSQHEIKVSDDIQWPACSSESSIRYAGNEEEVYIICTPRKTQSDASTESQENPSKDNYISKALYRLNYKTQFLDDLGKIRLNSFFESVEGQDVWQDDFKSIFQIIRTPDNETILLMAYLDSIDLWILNKDSQDKKYFDLTEKIWRGSALKWFTKFNAALYNLQFATESGSSESVLVPNPRFVDSNEYWPRERGRFIIRIFKNENLKNQTFDNRTRDQNLTYELLQSDLKPVASDDLPNHTYGLKVFVFFGISLAIFTVFGFAVFLKKCVNCLPRVRARAECRKSPLIIRYSVIPDDLVYPVA